MLQLTRGFRVLLLDMHSTFMFGGDRFGAGENFATAYARCGGTALSPGEVDVAIRAAHALLSERYADPAYEDDFPSVSDALRAVAPRLDAAEHARLIATFGHHECGTVPRDFAAALTQLSRQHQLRLISNIWAPKEPWLEELERADVLRLFERTVFSSDGRSLKPSSRLYADALRDLPCALDQVAMVGDSLRRDMVGGRRAGLATIWISATSFPLDAASAALVDYRVPSLLALVPFATSASVPPSSAAPANADPRP